MAQKWNVAVYAGEWKWDTEETDEHSARAAYRAICYHVLRPGETAVLCRNTADNSNEEERYKREV